MEKLEAQEGESFKVLTSREWQRHKGNRVPWVPRFPDPKTGAP